MFGKDFYPTPPEVIDQMLMGVDLSEKAILEPSAGKGNIVDELYRKGARQVLTFEKHPDLAKVVADKSSFEGHDFLECTPQQISHVDLIVMNPPFSNFEDHILHAWDVAPEGCKILALYPTEQLQAGYYKKIKQLQNIVGEWATKDIDLGDCFSHAERKTGVNVSLIELIKPVYSKDFDYEGFFFEEDPERDYPEGLMPYNEVRSIVSRYVKAVKCFDEFREIADRMDSLVAPIGLRDGFKFSFNYNDSVTSKADFVRKLQKTCWKYIFGEMDMRRFVTRGVMEKINRYVESQQKYPFTEKNIYQMFRVIIGTRGQIMNEALEEAFDNITKHYPDNRYGLQGWKTNSHYLVNRKFILDYMVEPSLMGDHMRFKYSQYTDQLTDLNKALCYLTASDNGLGDISHSLEKMNGGSLEFHQWYDWGFFEVKGFKKGTLHCKFKDEKVWELFNSRIAEIKGYPLYEHTGNSKEKQPEAANRQSQQQTVLRLSA